MWLIAGLGNPGSRYQRTRHNAGFLVVDKFAEHLRAEAWKKNQQYEHASASLSNGERVVLVKPQTFMNCSGDSLIELVGFYKCPVDRLIVIHDEIDLPFGTLRFKLGGGDGGHNGIKSIVSRIGSSGFVRLRVGVGRPEVVDAEKQPTQNPQQMMAVRDWVLMNFPTADQAKLDELLERAVKALELLLLDGLKKAQNVVNS